MICLQLHSWHPEKAIDINPVSKLTLNTRLTITMIINSEWYFCVIKRKHIQESNKYIFPYRNVILYSFGINSYITYLTKMFKL